MRKFSVRAVLVGMVILGSGCVHERVTGMTKDGDSVYLFGESWRGRGGDESSFIRRCREVGARLECVNLSVEEEARPPEHP